MYFSFPLFLAFLFLSLFVVLGGPGPVAGGRSVGQHDGLEGLAGILHGVQVVAEAFHEGRLLQEEAVGAAPKHLGHVEAAAVARAGPTAPAVGPIKEEAGRAPTVVHELLGIG